jgi:hypothetical protein
MTVADLIEYAKYGELAQLGAVVQLKSNDPIEIVDAEKQILSYINLGLIELYKRFNLKTDELVVVMEAAKTIYTITEPTFNNVYMVYDENGDYYSLNEEEDPLSILTPSYNTLQVPNPVAGEALYVLYNASPTKLVWVDDLSTLTVEIPPMMLEALLHYIGYRAHGSINGNVDGENNTHYIRFESSCNKIKELGALSDDALIHEGILESKGFV